jgi:hypothetical protein
MVTSSSARGGCIELEHAPQDLVADDRLSSRACPALGPIEIASGTSDALAGILA